MTGDVPLPVVVLGFLGQALFTLRMLLQWLASERARRSVMPRSFWSLSVAASALLLVYASFRNDGIFILGTLANTFIYIRNLFLSREGREQGRPVRKRVLVPILLSLLLFLALTVTERVGFSDSAFWVGLGLVGSGLWISRFVLQWWASERSGHTVVPAAFWIVSLAGSLLLLAYACHLGDLVFILAYIPGPLVFARNLALMARTRTA